MCMGIGSAAGLPCQLPPRVSPEGLTLQDAPRHTSLRFVPVNNAVKSRVVVLKRLRVLQSFTLSRVHPQHSSPPTHTHICTGGLAVMCGTTFPLSAAQAESRAPVPPALNHSPTSPPGGRRILLGAAPGAEGGDRVRHHAAVRASHLRRCTPRRIRGSSSEALRPGAATRESQSGVFL